MRRSQ
jgi:hypothetical protein